MTITSRVLTRIVQEDSAYPNDVDTIDRVASLAAAAALPKDEVVALAIGFTALSPPTGAKWVVIEPLAGAGTWVLKSQTGDTGISLGATLPAGVISMPVSAPTLGLTVGATSTVRVRWL